jgi:hypothetical protein
MLVLSVASEVATGRTLPSTAFITTEAERYLPRLGFSVVRTVRQDGRGRGERTQERKRSAFTAATLAGMDRRVTAVIDGFPRFVQVFDAKRRFGAPSIYFHDRILQGVGAPGSPSEALLDDGFVESLYAVLTAWGMHRMGSRGARMEEFQPFRESLHSQLPWISELEQHVKQISGPAGIYLAQLPDAEVRALTGELWSIISGLKLGKSRRRKSS